MPRIECRGPYPQNTWLLDHVYTDCSQSPQEQEGRKPCARSRASLTNAAVLLGAPPVLEPPRLNGSGVDILK